MNANQNKVTINIINIITGSQVTIIHGQSSLLTLKSLISAECTDIIITEAKRIFPINLSKTLAEELGMTLGKEIGYAIRNEEINGTVCRFVTDGWVVRQLEKDKTIEDVKYIIVDEAITMKGEYTDTMIAKLKDLIQQRKDLKIMFNMKDSNEVSIKAIKENFNASLYIV